VNLAPTLDLGLVPILRVTLEVFLGQLPGEGEVTSEFFADVGVAHNLKKVRFQPMRSDPNALIID
jgi:hypothetical protein